MPVDTNKTAIVKYSVKAFVKLSQGVYLSYSSCAVWHEKWTNNKDFCSVNRFSFAVRGLVMVAPQL